MRATRRTLNYTSRQRIDKQHVRAIAREHGVTGLLEIIELDLKHYGLPDNSPVILETRTRRDGLKRVSLGATPILELSNYIELDPEFFSSVRVSIKILDPNGTGKIIGLAEEIDLEIPEKLGKRSLLPTFKVDGLGERIWRLRADSDGFALEVNKYFPKVGEVVHENNPAFLALVMPEVIRQIAYLVATETSEVAQTIQEKWNRLFEECYADTEGWRSERPQDWADAVAKALSEKFNVLNSYRSFWRED